MDLAKAVIADYEQFVVPSYKRSLVMVRGKGSRVWDSSDKSYLDFGGGIAVNCLGHAPEVIAKALSSQAHTLIHTSNLYYNQHQGLLARRLVELTGPGKMFFCNSGAEANEALYKLARRFGNETGRFEIITTLNSFHGRTLAGISATGQDKIKKGFGPLMSGFLHVPYNDLAAMKAAITPQTAAILIEGIQGESGVFPATPEYLLGLRKLCDEKKILLLMDCVQCGMYRTGRFMSYQKILEGVSGGEVFLPDGIAMAKSLGSGFPIGAAWMRNPYGDLLQPGSHGTTYGGTPLASVVALTVLDTIQLEHLDENIQNQGNHLMETLNSIKASSKRIKAIRGFGGMIGIETDLPGVEMAQVLMEDGLLIAPAGENNFRLLPPLNVTRTEVIQALAILKKHL